MGRSDTRVIVLEAGGWLGAQQANPAPTNFQDFQDERQPRAGSLACHPWPLATAPSLRLFLEAPAGADIDLARRNDRARRPAIDRPHAGNRDVRVPRLDAGNRARVEQVQHVGVDADAIVRIQREHFLEPQIDHVFRRHPEIAERQQQRLTPGARGRGPSTPLESRSYGENVLPLSAR